MPQELCWKNTGVYPGLQMLLEKTVGRIWLYRFKTTSLGSWSEEGAQYTAADKITQRESCVGAGRKV